MNTTTQAAAVRTPSREELVGRARELAPEIGARALECERLQRMPDENHEAFVDAGFYRILQPKRYGGYEMDLMTLWDVSREIGRGGCASSAWVLSILAIHNFYLGYYDDRAQRDIWGEDENFQTCTPFVPSGKTKKVKGGIELTDGHWTFASGCDHSEFALLGTLLDHGEGGPPEFVQCVVHKDDFSIDHDSWKVAGLRGTGSKDIRLDGAFVPDHGIFSLARVTAEDYAPGREVNDGPLYRQPFFPASICSLVAPAQGAALCALDAFKGRLKTRVLAFGDGSAQEEKVPSQLRMVEAESEIQAAEMLIMSDSEHLHALAERNQPADAALRARTLWHNAYGTTLLTRAVERLFVASGGGALQENNPIQRAWRDIHAVNSHAGMNFDGMGELYGRVSLGLPANSPLA